MSSRPHLLLLDAVAIIGAFEYEVWDALGAYRRVVPSIVIHSEVQFYEDRATQRRVEIDLPDRLRRGEIEEHGAPIAELAQVLEIFDEGFREGLHEGELEALHYIWAHGCNDVAFVTSDRVAIKAATMLGAGDAVFSLENILKMCGHQRTDLKSQYCSKFVQEAREAGGQNFLTGVGYKSGKRPAKLTR
jgi:hypothetical protein